MASDRVPYVETFAERMAKMNESPMLDVQVCDHCNLRCAGCRHCENSALTVVPWERSKFSASEWLA